jgi:hypothetical protein
LSSLKDALIYTLIIFAFFLFPFFSVIAYNVPFENEVNFNYVSSSITTAGILIGFIGSATIAKYQQFEQSMLYIITFNFIVFFMSVWQFFLNSLEGQPTITTLSWITGSILSNSATVSLILIRFKDRRLT